MNYSGEAADQVVRLVIQGTEVALKLTGTAAERIAVLIYTMMKEQHKTAGQIRLASMLKSGKEMYVFTIMGKDLSAFAEEAKRYGVLYCALKARNTEKGLTDVMVYKEDASKINRIVEKLSLATVEAAKGESEQAELPENPTIAERGKESQSGPTSKTEGTTGKESQPNKAGQVRKTPGKDTPDAPRRSVRKDIDEIRQRRNSGLSEEKKEKARGPYPTDAKNLPAHMRDGRAR
jgi:hypothetical protein